MTRRQRKIERRALSTILLFGRLALCSCLAVLSSLVLGASPVQTQSAAGKLYKQAAAEFEKGQWKAAERDFRQVYQLLSQRKTTSDQQKAFLLMGRADVYYHLAIIAQRQKQTYTACERFQTLSSLLGKLPNKWETLPLNPLLPERFKDGQAQLARCQKIPSRLALTGLPPTAKIEIKQQSKGPDGKVKVTWLPVTSPIQTTASKVTLRITAPGFTTQVVTKEVPRWRVKTAAISLKPAPIARPRARPPVVVARPKVPPPKKGLSKGAWAAIIGGSVALVAAGVVAAILLTGEDDDPALKEPVVWGTPQVATP